MRGSTPRKLSRSNACQPSGIGRCPSSLVWLRKREEMQLGETLVNDLEHARGADNQPLL